MSEFLAEPELAAEAIRIEPIVQRIRVGDLVASNKEQYAPVSLSHRNQSSIMKYQERSRLGYEVVQSDLDADPIRVDLTHRIENYNHDLE